GLADMRPCRGKAKKTGVQRQSADKVQCAQLARPNCRSLKSRHLSTRIVDMPHALPLAAPRILIVRLSAIGDVIHGLPVLCALREAFPDSYLAWVAEGMMGDVLEGHPALDELVRVPRRWWKSPREVWRMTKRLRRMKFDI